MKVRELLTLLLQQNVEAEVLVRLDGVIYPTASVEESEDYNDDQDRANEFFIVTDRFPPTN